MHHCDIFEAVEIEIESAEKNHPTPSFPALVEEVGEVAKAIEEEGLMSWEYRAELIQVACVAVRLIQQADRMRNEAPL